MYITHFPDIRLNNSMWWLIDPVGRVQLCLHMLLYNTVYAQVTIIKHLLTYLLIKDFHCIYIAYMIIQFITLANNEGTYKPVRICRLARTFAARRPDVAEDSGLTLDPYFFWLCQHGRFIGGDFAYLLTSTSWSYNTFQLKHSCVSIIYNCLNILFPDSS